MIKMNKITIEKEKRHYFEYDNQPTSYQEKIELMSCDDDFENVRASAITGEELRQRMYSRIDSWQWNEK